MWHPLPDSILSLVYPQECSVCHGEVESPDDGHACSACWTTTRIFNGNETLCIKCGAFLSEGSPRDAVVSCQKCTDHHFDRAFSIGVYEKALSATILRLKREPYVPRRLTRLLTLAFEGLPTLQTPVLVPVPLSNHRRVERGFNQAAVLTGIVSKRTGVPVDEHSLERNTHTPMHRAGMDRKGRALTVKNAFTVVRPKLIEGRDIILVDDVLTSGATVSSCANVLKRIGAATVHVLTVARAA